ncbi:hypothetical protein N7462_000103 [Penicillium macrosclerotiorum]|uniref:uncharacterized protein n=1 Tax=Penicillium macrosclerotiorum TaxID=303699 RepID=UPI0025487637|nr:uncharacterized protein N7462_000103 [Penicillium macrosclerotiorum]KAJ5698098.1 hypothetical protein N7462_000103 [Penicillium macrosclerotiorum]
MNHESMHGKSAHDSTDGTDDGMVDVQNDQPNLLPGRLNYNTGDDATTMGNADRLKSSEIEDVEGFLTSPNSLLLDPVQAQSTENIFSTSSQRTLPPSSSKGDRKRRLTGNGDGNRLQRTRSGGASSQNIDLTRNSLPHRSVSMVAPSSRGASSNVPGSSYENALDITSSPPDTNGQHSPRRSDVSGRLDRQLPSRTGPSGPQEYQGRRYSQKPLPRWPSNNDLGGPARAVSSNPVTSSFSNLPSQMVSRGPRRNSDAIYLDDQPDRYRLLQSRSGSDVIRNSERNCANWQQSTADDASRLPYPSVSSVSRHQGRGQQFLENQESAFENQASLDSEHGSIEETSIRNDSCFLSPNGAARVRHDNWRGNLRTGSNSHHSGRDDGVILEGTSRWSGGGGDGMNRERFNRRRPSGSSNQGSQWRTDQTAEAYQDLDLPRWQPDSEVTSCPICGTIFSFWYRKHHCRKCGRVVCASCSPHRITIPRQFIVRPLDSPTPVLPGSSSTPPSRSSVIDLTGDDPDLFTSTINPALGGGEEVRLCNPCVPDPNPNPLGYGSPRALGHRSTHSLSATMGQNWSAPSRGISRLERRTVGDNDRPSFLRDIRQSTRRSSFTQIPSSEEELAEEAERRTHRRDGYVIWARPPPEAGPSSQPWTQFEPSMPIPSLSISERDICPICGRIFMPLSEHYPQSSREAHVRDCLARRDTQHAGTQLPPPPPAAARMLEFAATEKDCLGDDSATECMICMEEYKVGDKLARLECLCKFHKRCIVGWFERKMECPVHKPS